MGRLNGSQSTGHGGLGRLHGSQSTGHGGLGCFESLQFTGRGVLGRLNGPQSTGHGGLGCFESLQFTGRGGLELGGGLGECGEIRLVFLELRVQCRLHGLNFRREHRLLVVLDRLHGHQFIGHGGLELGGGSSESVNTLFDFCALRFRRVFIYIQIRLCAGKTAAQRRKLRRVGVNVNILSGDCLISLCITFVIIVDILLNRRQIIQYTLLELFVELLVGFQLGGNVFDGTT